MPDLNHYRDLCHAASAAAGWWPPERRADPEFHAVKVALIHSEASELLEGIRTGALDKHVPTRSSAEVECADLLHRIFDLAGALELDLDGALADKMAYNRTRHDHTQAARASSGGKKF